MKPNRYFLFASLTAAILLNSSAYAQDASQRPMAIDSKYQDAAKLVDVWLSAQRDYHQIPFLTGAVVDDQTTLWSRSYGLANVESNLAANNETMASICSTSKVVTATAIMKLIDEGKLKLDDKLTDILPKYKVNQVFPDSEKVTVKHLLTHTSGLPRDTVHSYWSGPDHHFPNQSELYESLSQQETEFAVGTNSTYSNVGYALLGLVVEKVSGESYGSYLDNALFTPLQMTNSTAELPLDNYGKQHAKGYTAINRDGKRQTANTYQTRAMQGAAGISSTAQDLTKFTKWQFRTMESDSDVMTSATLNSMYEVQAENNNGRLKRGYGYQVAEDKKGTKWAMHGGMCPGYVSYLKMDVSNKRAFIFMTNSNGVRAISYINGLTEIFNRADALKQKQSSHIDLSQYEGFYDLNPWNSEFYVGKWGDGLVLLYLPVDNMKYAMYHYQHIEGDTFELVENGQLQGERLEFVRDESGNIYKVNNGGQYNLRLAK